MKTSIIAILLTVSVLLACSHSPTFDTVQVDFSLTPQAVVAQAELNRGKTILWGGTILDTQNLKQSTQIEVLAYPLDSSFRPLLEKKPLGRFIIKHHNYLEANTYSQGRIISVLGVVDENKQGQIGESIYTYAVINSQQLHLWPKNSGNSRTRFHIGVGIGL